MPTDDRRPTVFVLATEDFDVYHDVVRELRNRHVEFTTVEPETELPPETRILIVGPDEAWEVDVPVVVAEPGEPRRAVDDALAALREREGGVVVGIDPGARPGIAVLVGDTVIAAFQVPLDAAASVVEREVAEAPDAVVRIGDGARLQGSRLVDELGDMQVELVDETGTTPYLGTGARGMGDVLAAVNIARSSGTPIEGRSIEPTDGEIQAIKDRSRRASNANRTITDSLARKVANGELTMEEALETHRRE